MPKGTGLTLDFSTRNTGDDLKTYSFSTGGAGLPPMDMGGLVSFDGASVGVRFEPNLNYHFELYPVQSGYNQFEFRLVNSFAFAYTAANVSFDIQTTRRQWNNINLTSATGGDSNGFVKFELGATRFDVFYGGGAYADSTNYDLNFDDAGLAGYDMEFRAAEDTVIQYYHENEVFAYGAAEVAEADLTTDHNVLHQDMHICGSPTGATVLDEITSDTLAGEDPAPARILNQNLIFLFDNVAPCTGVFDWTPAADGAATSADLVLSSIEISTGGPSLDFNLIECDNTTDFDLGSCGAYIGGKNLNYDILICAGETNPPLNGDVHNFGNIPDFFGKVCGALMFNFGHGSSARAEISADVLFNDVDPNHGANASTDLVISQNLATSAYAGADAVLNSFSTRPAQILQPSELAHGSSTDFTLSTISIFEGVGAYHGAILAGDVSTFAAPTLPSDAYHGAAGDFELNTQPVFSIATAHNGALGSVSLRDFPSVELTVDSYAGENTSIVVLRTPHFSTDGYHGLDSVLDLETAESEGFGDFYGYTGADALTDFSTATTFDGVATHGIDALTEISTATAVDATADHGIYGDVELTLNLADEFEPIATYGSYGEFDLGLVKALFPRAYAGFSADLDLTDAPALEFALSAYSGSNGTAILIEADFNTYATHGATLEDFSMAISVNLPFEPMEHGAVASAVEIKRATTLEADATHGAGGYLSNFDVPAGESIMAVASHGATLTPSLDALISAHLEFIPINASLALYDGFGGVGGLNHCPINSEELDPLLSDGVTRLGYDPLGITDRLNFSFDDIGVEAWSVCNAGGIDFDWDLQTQQRFEFTAHAGEAVAAELPMKLMALIGEDVPVARLYDWEYTVVPLNPPEDEPVVESPPSAPAEFEIWNGSRAIADLATVEYAWKRGAKAAEFGDIAEFTFEPVDYTRFCKGYIIPNGNSAVFDFGVDAEKYDCLGWNAQGGATMLAELSQAYQPGVRAHSGQYAVSSLTIAPIWELRAYGGQRLYVHPYSEAELELHVRHGSSVLGKFEELPIIGEHGAYMELDTLTVPGPAVRWQIPTQCLPNDYLPMTEDGDIDYDALNPDENGVIHFPSVPVEYKQYRYVLDARCITYDQSQTEGDE